MTLAFWLGFAVGTLMWIVIAVLAAVRMAGLCSEAERSQTEAATINGREVCAGCGVPLTNGMAVLHHSQCWRMN